LNEKSARFVYFLTFSQSSAAIPWYLKASIFSFFRLRSESVNRVNARAKLYYLYINITYLTKKYELIIIKHLSKVSMEIRRHILGLI